MIVGHAAAVAALHAELPPVTLLIGPRSVGKHTLARHLADHHGIHPADRYTATTPLNADEARRIITYATVAPFGPHKLITITLDRASTAACNILLKTLEEPPPTVRIILIATTPPINTIMSRSRIFRLGYLTHDNLCQIFTAHGMSPTAARNAATRAKGQVASHNTDTSARETVIDLLGAIATSDRHAFERIFADRYTDGVQALLTTALTEAITARWATFNPAETHGLHRQPQRLLTLLTTLHNYRTASEKIGTRAAVEQFLNPQ